jgi:hypothetical protein
VLFAFQSSFLKSKYSSILSILRHHLYFTYQFLIFIRITDELNKVKYDLISLSNDFKSDVKYHEWIKEQRKYILPNKKSFDKDSIYYDLCSNTQDYLKPYIYINKQLEIEPFLTRISHKPKDHKIEKKINGLLSHKENKQECEIIHNRDKNAVQNMLYIVKHIFATGRRPEAFSRIHT